jgi:uncharacterized protein YktA (UPF0223 family)
MENENVLWIEVNLKTQFYQPEKIEKGMWFINSLYPGTDREFVEIWELEEDIEENDYDKFFSKNGFPIDVLLTIEVDNPNELDDVIAYSEDIGWFYDNDEELMEIVNIKILNNIIQLYESKVFLLVDSQSYNDFDEILPEKENNLVIFTYPFEEEFEEEFE